MNIQKRISRLEIDLITKEANQKIFTDYTDTYKPENYKDDQLVILLDPVYRNNEPTFRLN